VVLKDKAAMFVDGRYTLQVRDQVDGRFWDYESVPQTSVAKWLGANAPEGAKIGYDAWLHGKPWVTAVEKALAERGASLVAVAANPVDAVWHDRPEPSPAPATVHATEHAGQSSQEKRAQVAEWLAEKKLDAVVIAALDSLAWLFNIRGADVERTPVALGFALVHADGTADLFMPGAKLPPKVRAHLGNAVRLAEREAFVPALGEL
jgi:Xaa-Pro aminopeptidase